MSGKVERAQRKARLLREIQQQRLDLSASRRDWLGRSWLEHAAEFAFLGAGRQQRDGGLDDSPS